MVKEGPKDLINRRFEGTCPDQVCLLNHAVLLYDVMAKYLIHRWMTCAPSLLRASQDVGAHVETVRAITFATYTLSPQEIIAHMRVYESQHEGQYPEFTLKQNAPQKLCLFDLEDPADASSPIGQALARHQVVTVSTSDQHSPIMKRYHEIRARQRHGPFKNPSKVIEI